jgi:hypothetical protein
VALIGLIDLEEPLDARAEAALHRALREAGVTRMATPADAAKFDRGDRILLVGADTLIDGAMITAMAEAPTTTLACLPNDPDTSHYELIDGATRWAGWAALPGDIVAETAQTLDPDWSLASTLVRKAVQQGALRVDAGRAGALIALNRPDAVAAVDEARLHTAMRPRAGIPGRLVERAAEFVGEALLGVEHGFRWVSGVTVALFAGASVSLFYGWIAPAALAFVLLTVSVRALRGLTLVAGRPVPWLDRAVDAAALGGLVAITGWTWTWSGQWGVIPLAIVLAADTAMAAEEELDAQAPSWWRGDAPAYAMIMLLGSLAGQPIAALVAATAYASISFAAARRRLRAQRRSSET